MLSAPPPPPPRFQGRLRKMLRKIYCTSAVYVGEYARCSWLRPCATSRKVAGSISDGVIGIFGRYNPFGRVKGLRSTQSLTEIRTKAFPGGKGGVKFFDLCIAIYLCNKNQQNAPFFH